MKISFKDLTTLYKNVSPRQHRGGDFCVSSSNHLELLKTLVGDVSQYGVRLVKPYDIDEVKIGTTVQVELHDPRTGLGILADNFDSVLDYPKSRVQRVNFYLLDCDWASGDENPPPFVQSYELVLKLVELLSNVAAYLDKSSSPPQLVFIQSGKFTVPVNYTRDDLNSLDVANIIKLIGFFDVDLHKDQKQKILEKVICETLGSISQTERFPKLLKEVAVLTQKLNDGYALFAADFSYDKVVNQLEVAKLEELAKINKVFSDIQNQILGIPVASVVVATQLKTASAVNDVFWINTSVLVGVWVFVVLVNFVLRNQTHTLEAISLETERKQAQIEREFAAVKSTINTTFKLIASRIKHQRFVLRAVDFIAAFGFLLAHVVYFALTGPAMEWLSKSWSILLPYLVKIWNTLS